MLSLSKMNLERVSKKIYKNQSGLSKQPSQVPNIQTKGVTNRP